MGLTGVTLVSLFFVSTVVVIIGTGSPDWAHAVGTFPKDDRHKFLYEGDAFDEDEVVYSDSYSVPDASSTGSADSNEFHLDIELSSFGYQDNDRDSYFWLKPNCKIYDADGDFVFELPTNGECDETRSVQVMSLFAVFFSFFAFLGSVSLAMKGEKGADQTTRKATMGSAFLAAVSGIIAMSIFVDQKQHERGSFFSIGGDEFHYGYGLGLFTGGWCLNLIGLFAVHQAKLGAPAERPHVSAGNQLLIFFFFVATVSLIIGTGSPEWAVNYNNGEVEEPVFSGIVGELDVGPFGFYSGELNKFFWLRPNCEIYNEDGERYQTIDSRALCDEFRTEQCFAILACVFAFLGLVVSLRQGYRGQPAAGLIAFYGVFAAVCGIISMAEFIDQKDEDRAWFTDGGDYWDYGYSLGLFTAGWMASLIGGVLAICVRDRGNAGHHHPDTSKPDRAAPSIQAQV